MKNLDLAEAFIIQYPIMPGHPGMDHVTLTSHDLDKFAAANGVYGNASPQEMNDWRNRMVGQLNAAGESKKWLDAKNPGFQLVVTKKNKNVMTEWMLKPFEVAGVHTTFALPDRNKKTITNRALKLDKMLGKVDTTKLPKEEAKVIAQQRDALIGMAQLQISMATNQAKLLAKTQKMLEKVDPQHRMLPK